MSSEPIHVTREGYERLKAELDELVNVRRPQLVKAVASAREEGDLRENAGYHAARHDLGMVEGRIKQLEQMLKRAEIIANGDAPAGGGTVVLGSTVTIEIDGDKETYTIVGPVEANPSEGRISNASPFGQALLGARVGDLVTINTPAAVLKARVLSVA